MGKQPVTLKSLLERLVKAYRLEKPLKRLSSVQKWAAVVEENLRDKTRAVAFKDGKLFVEVASSTLRNELLYRREQYKAKLNREVGAKVVEDIIFINRRNYGRTV